MKHLRYLIITPLFLWAGSPSLEADLNIQSGYYSNIFNSSVAGSQKFIYIDGLLNFPIQKTLAVYGGAEGVFYSPTNAYSNYTLEGGLFGYKQLYQKLLLNGGIYISTERFEATYDYYNSEKIGGYANLVYYLNPQVNVRIGYSFEKSTYADLEGVNNGDHQLYFKMNRSFDSGTAVMGYTGFGTQNFERFNPEQPLIVSRSDYSASQQFETNRIYNFQFRVSQSITEKAGIALTLEHKNILDLNRDIIYYDQYFYNPLQDRFQWQGNQIDLKMTFMPKHDIQITAASLFRSRSYDNNPVYDYDLEGESYKTENGEYILLDNARLDETAKIEVNLEKIWFRDIYEFEKNMGLNLTAGYALNMSNDPIYNSTGLFSFLSLQYYY